MMQLRGSGREGEVDVFVNGRGGQLVHQNLKALPQDMTSRPGSLPAAQKPASRPAEKQLAPGIYFTPAPSSSNDFQNAGNPDALPDPPNVNDMTRDELETEYRAISKSVQKLEESNVLMTEFDPDGKDAELVEAIRENKGIVIRKKTRMISVKARLDYLIRSQPHIKSSRRGGGGARSGATQGGSQAAEASSEAGLHL